MDDYDLHGWARQYAARGWPVLPLFGIENGICLCRQRHICPSPGKHPMRAGGAHSGTTDARQIDDFWRQHPQANVGISTGAQAGLLVLDVDIAKGGTDSLALYEERYGALPPTIRQITGSGGAHYLFAHPGGTVFNAVAFAPGLDIRADGGLIVAPPSRHACGGRYLWDVGAHPDDTRLARPPDWLLRVVQARRTMPKAPIAPGKLIEGERNMTVTRVAGALRRIGLEPAVITLMLDVLNEQQCHPPLDTGEIERIAQSVGRYDPAGAQFRVVEVV